MSDELGPISRNGQDSQKRVSQRQRHFLISPKVSALNSLQAPRIGDTPYRYGRWAVRCL